jgi:6-phosphofructokinase 2
MLKALQEESICFEAIETRSGTRENFVAVDDNTNSQFRFVFRHHPLQSLKR